jgi:hypothetical protein
MKDKEFILGEIRRTAAFNGGKPLGQRAFTNESGIAKHEWEGVHWVRWSDALSDAGFSPLEWGKALDEEQMFDELAKLARKYNRFPFLAEIRIGKRTNDQIPSVSALQRRFGQREEMIQRVRDYCGSREEYADVFAILDQESIITIPENGTAEINNELGKVTASGYVYLVKSGKLYKIGCTENHWRRKSELHKQTAEGIVEVHTIAAIDDPTGIEKYWHGRFKDKRLHGEWFDLSAEDVSAFKKRKFM